MTLLAAAASLSHADPYPEGDVQIPMHAFWQNYVSDWSYNIMGCQDNDAACKSQWQGFTIGSKGCTVTSMAMLYYMHGFQVIPDALHTPTPFCILNYCSYPPLNPGSFNNYLSGKDSSGGLLGFESNHGLNWLKTTSNFYYYDPTPGAYGTSLHYSYVVPNYDCGPYVIKVPTRKGYATYNIEKEAVMWLIGRTQM